jgi:5'-3' exonuclease
MSEKKENLVIIDADSMFYLIGSELANMQLEPLGFIKLDEFIKDILVTTGARNYLGFIGGKGHNFRKDIAVTKPYKGQRPEKPEWFEFWQPILAKRMVEFWGFQECHNIEADDACAIARNKYIDDYNKVIIASPDKDLIQIGNTWFYDYTKRTTVFCNDTVALHSLCGQLVMGDSTDNIPGCMGAGKVTAGEVVQHIASKGMDKEAALAHVKAFYIEWFTVTLKNKQHKKQEKEYLDKYKATHSIKTLTAAKKSEALKGFVLDTSMIMDRVDVLKLFKEQFSLVKLIETEEEAKKHKFDLGTPTVDTRVDWDSIEIFDMEMDNIADEEDFPFADEL